MVETVEIPAGVFVKAEDALGSYEVFIPNKELLKTASSLLKAYLRSVGEQ